DQPEDGSQPPEQDLHQAWCQQSHRGSHERHEAGFAGHLNEPGPSKGRGATSGKAVPLPLAQPYNASNVDTPPRAQNYRGDGYCGLRCPTLSTLVATSRALNGSLVPIACPERLECR